MTAAASRFSISSRTSSIAVSPSEASAHASSANSTASLSTPPVANPPSADGVPAPSTASPRPAQPFRWLLLDVDASSQPFLRALAASSEAASTATSSAAGEQRSTDRSITLSSANQTKLQQKHSSALAAPQGAGAGTAAATAAMAAVGQLDKRLSLPFGGSINNNAPSSSSRGPSKKPSFMSKLRSGSISISSSSAASSSSEKENLKSADASSAGHQPASAALSPKPLLSPTTPDARPAPAAGVSRGAVAVLASTSPEAAARLEFGAKLLEQCCVQHVEAGTSTATPIRLDPQMAVDLADKEGIDAVYIGGGGGREPDRALATALLRALLSAGPQRGPKSVVVDPTVSRSLTVQDATSLVNLTTQKGMRLALPTKWGRDAQASARTLVEDFQDDAESVGGERKLYSQSFRWEETLAVLETLDEIRQASASFPSLAATDGSAAGLAKIDDVADTSMDSVTSGRTEGTDLLLPVSPRLGADASDDSATANKVTTAALRAKLQEVQHILRQKNALIAALEQQARSGGGGGGSPNPAGGASGSSAKNGRSPSPAASLRTRRTSTGTTANERIPAASSSSRPVTPTRTRKSSSSAASLAGDVGDDGSSTPRRPAPSVRTRKNSRNTSLGEVPLSLSPPISSINQFESGPGSPSLEPVKETRRNMDTALAAGFGEPTSASHRSPTVASEARRIASLTQHANGIAAGGGGANGGGGGGGGSGKVIHALTAELEETRLQLDLTRTRLRAAQLQASNLQRQHDDLKDSLARTRLENESNAQILSRKDRQVSEALERARKAELEAKELGRSSREWGTRVREVEAQLGQERIAKARAEAQYEALSTSWKTTREKLQQDVESLRKEVETRAVENNQEAKKLLSLKKEMENAWKQRDMEKGALGDLLERLASQQEYVEGVIKESVGGLMQRLEGFERQTKSQDEEVEYVGIELRRILRLMRSGTSDPNAP